MKILSALILSASCLLTTTLSSEIQQVTVRWTSLLCKETCVRLLEREFKKVQGIDHFNIDQGGGQATLTWKPKAPFQYSAINYAMRAVGISLRDIRIKVRGIIKSSGNAVYIISEGDNTRLELVNPVVPNPKGQAPQFNYGARLLSPVMRQKLLDGEKLRQIATIEGPVFMPERNTIPTQIVVDSLSFEDEKTKPVAK